MVSLFVHAPFFSQCRAEDVMKGDEELKQQARLKFFKRLNSFKLSH